MLSDNEIEAGKSAVKYSLNEGAHHEHDDCIRLAYEWLDAQNTVKNAGTKHFALKHIIEKWAGRYISQSDVDVAAAVHHRITGRYPNFNLSTRLVRPNDRRLAGIGQALSQGYRENIEESVYKIVEA